MAKIININASGELKHPIESRNIKPNFIINITKTKQ